jgi:hypothetical protein
MWEWSIRVNIILKDDRNSKSLYSVGGVLCTL